VIILNTIIIRWCNYWAWTTTKVLT